MLFEFELVHVNLRSIYLIIFRKMKMEASVKNVKSKSFILDKGISFAVVYREKIKNWFTAI